MRPGRSSETIFRPKYDEFTTTSTVEESVLDGTVNKTLEKERVCSYTDEILVSVFRESESWDEGRVQLRESHGTSSSSREKDLLPNVNLKNSSGDQPAIIQPINL
jgi:hypothetical protein